MTSSRGKLRGAYYLISFVSCFVNLSGPSVAATVTTARTDIDNDAVGAGANKSSHDGNENHDDPSSPTPHSASVVEETIAQKYIRHEASGREQPQQQQQQQQRQLQYTPPTHFQISAHVQTNLHTGYSYFLPLDESFAHLPFLECGAVGSTTESLPLVSGVFRHVPHTSVIPKRDESAATVMMHGHGVDAIPDEGEDGDLRNETSNKDEAAAEAAADAGAAANDGVDDHPKRPSPPKYVVALSSMEITVGGNGNNETQKFVAGDVIFIEDAWWGIWDNDDELIDSSKGEDAPDDVTGEEDSSEGADRGEYGNGVDKMKGYIMRASSQSQTDLQVFMLTVPNAVHRHWKNAQYAAAMTRRDEQEAREKRRQSTLNTEIGTRRPWWNHPPSTFLPTRNSNQNHRQLKPCTLEAFSHPSAMSSTTLSQHFTQHFTSLLRRSTNPIPSFLPCHYNQDLLLHVLAQTAAAAFGGMTTFALVQLWWRIIPGPIAVWFGSACLVGLGTWGFVWLGEEISDQWELWRERRRLGRMMSEGWGTGMSGGTGDGR